MSDAEPFLVADWTVRPRLHRLEQGGEVRRVSPKAMAALLCLRRRAGRVVSKDELVAEVWDQPFTSDEALTSVVYELRRAFGDDARRPRVIETIRKSGFRLVAPVVEIAPGAAAPAEIAPVAAAPPLAEAPAPPPRRRGAWLAVAALLAVVAGGGWAAVRTWSGDVAVVTPVASPIRTLAVLPFGAFRAGEEEPLAAALTEMLTAELAQVCAATATVVPGIVVRDRAEPWGLAESREVLGVDAVVEGAVWRYGDRVWVSVHLVDSRTGTLLWTRSWDRAHTDAAAVLREVALEASEELGVRLDP